MFARSVIPLAEDLRNRGGIDPRESFIEGTFGPAKERGNGRPLHRHRRRWKIEPLFA
jgi:hypothetical protein